MSELLQNWLNNEVGLSTNVSNFEKDFSSGYLFGEILHKFWQADFEQFQNKNSHQAKIANFKTLEPILKALGIKFNATLINAVMNGERGAALRLLYQLKMASERSERPALALQASALEMQASVGWPGASMKVRQARVEKLTRKFELEKHKQEIVAYEMDNIEQAHVEEQRQIHRFSLRERLRQNRAAKDEWEARGHELWQDNMKVRMARETEQMRFSDKVFRTQQEKEQQQRRFAASEVLQGTKDFEAGLQNLGITKAIEEGMPEDSSGEDDDATAERLLAQTSKVASAKELVDALQAKLPTNQELNYEAGLFMRKIKESKQAGTIARRERERRRRRVLVEQQREQEMLEENQLEQVLMEKLNRESIEESAISYRSWRAKTFEEVFVRNRQARQQQYIAKKKADKEEALKWDQDLRDEMIETLREQEERERVRYRAVERFRHAKRREKLREEMEGILELIVQMAFADLQQEQLTDKEEVDSTLWREWVALFEENLPVMPLPSLQMCAEEPAPLTALPEPTGLANLHSVGATLNSAALRDFMDARGQWQVPMVEGDDEELQEEVPASQPTVEAFNADAEVAATLEEDDPSSFHLGPEMTIFPQFMYHLRRSNFLQTFNASPDETAYYRMLILHENTMNSLVMIQPALLQYSFEEGPPQPVLLDATSLKPNVILLLDSFFHVVIWRGEMIQAWYDAGYQEKEEYANFKALLTAPAEDAKHILADRFPVPKFIQTNAGGSQARFLTSKVNPSQTHNTGGAGGPYQGQSDSSVVITDDVSLKVFMEHLIRLAVQS